MGLDLTLLFTKETIGCSGNVFAYSRLSFDRDYRLFRQIIEIEGSKPIIKSIIFPPEIFVSVYKDEGLDNTREDAYGTELTYVSAKELKKLKVYKESSDFNKAIKAFISALPDNYFIIFYWS